MSDWLIAVLALAVPAALVAAAALVRRRIAGRGPAEVIGACSDSTRTARSGAVRSVQGADLELPAHALDELWTPTNLERLARTYWRFLSRVTLGLVRVHYTERERSVVLLVPWLKLITFRAPDYEMSAERGVVRWRIERGLLVAHRGRGHGYLKIDVCRRPNGEPTRARLHVEVEVASFYPAIAIGLGRWLYNETQSRIHVVVTKSFLRSLARLDLAESRVRRLEPLPAPPDAPPAGAAAAAPDATAAAPTEAAPGDTDAAEPRRRSLAARS